MPRFLKADIIRGDDDFIIYREIRDHERGSKNWEGVVKFTMERENVALF